MIDLEKHIKRNVVNGRNLSEYENVLGFKRSDLEGHRVLNFGSAGSNIGKELKQNGINCQVVDTDILPNPHSVHDEKFSTDEYSFRRAALERKVREHVDGQMLLRPIEQHEDIIFGIDGRDFIRLDDSGKLPFPDDSFDDVFVSWVFHQLSRELQIDYLQEFMRIGKNIYIAPVGRKELREIEHALINSQFTIESILHYGDQIDEPVWKDEQTRRRNGYTDDGYTIGDLDIDYGERPYTVTSSGCVKIILKKNNL